MKDKYNTSGSAMDTANHLFSFSIYLGLLCLKNSQNSTQEFRSRIPKFRGILFKNTKLLCRLDIGADDDIHLMINVYNDVRNSIIYMSTEYPLLMTKDLEEEFIGYIDSCIGTLLKELLAIVSS